MSESKEEFTSRRQRRNLERDPLTGPSFQGENSRASEANSSAQPKPSSYESQQPATELPTRRNLRLADSAKGFPTDSGTSALGFETRQAEPPLPSRRDILAASREQALGYQSPLVDQTISAQPTYQPQPTLTSAQEVSPAPATQSLAKTLAPAQPENPALNNITSGPITETFLEKVPELSLESITNLGTEPISASIVVHHVPDIENNVISIPGTGDFLRTGAIELPRDTSSGGISMILQGQAADEALVQDSLNSFVSSVPPVRATGLAKKRSKNVEIALNSRSGKGQVFLVVTTAVLMITVGALVVAAYLLGMFK